MSGVDKLATLPAALVKDVSKALFAAGESIQVEAQISITAGAVSGKGHVPSRPGSPPNQDSGFLGAFIETHQAEPLKVEVVSLAPYSTALEFGTSKMSERPFFRPARDKMAPHAQKLVAQAINRALRKHFGGARSR